MRTPPVLTKGDKIAIVAPARKISLKEIKHAFRILEKWGFDVVPGKHLFGSCRQYSGTDEQRAADFQRAMDNPEIKAILCARGGYGCIRIIDRLDFSSFRRNPKWIIGFSDITALHSHIHTNYRIETLHAPMGINIGIGTESVDAVRRIMKVITGNPLRYSVKSHPLNRKGSATGELTGGNLSVLYSLRGTRSEIKTKGKILFLEDLDEYLYHIDRMMMNLKRGGMLENIAGLVIGTFTKMKDNKVPFGKTAYEIIADTIAEYNYPICFGFPAGHIKNNNPLIMGRKVHLSVGKGILLKFQ
ncbi:MAG: LD-carboxypeptidase [Bacteroidetes bacterium]|nr:LD-carboxypeptidase [Bacteroidota bacterium]